MSKKPLSFTHLALAEERTSTLVEEYAPQPERAAEESLKEASAHRMVYLHPEAAKAIDRYALEQTTHKRKVKPHDLMIEAVEMWLKSKGIDVPVRAKERR